jgi:hypothetical protein
MTRRIRPTFFVISLLITVVGTIAPVNRARADEEDDIQRQIETQKSGVSDLEHLDARHSAAPDLQRLRDWLAEAWDLRNKHEPDEAREVLDRCGAQADLIRQIISAAQAKSDVASKEAQLQKTRDTLNEKKKALLDAQAKKKALEPTAGA